MVQKTVDLIGYILHRANRQLYCLNCFCGNVSRKKRSLVVATSAAAPLLPLWPSSLVLVLLALETSSFLHLTQPLAQASAWRSLECIRLEPKLWSLYPALCCRKSRQESALGSSTFSGALLSSRPPTREDPFGMFSTHTTIQAMYTASLPSTTQISWIKFWEAYLHQPFWVALSFLLSDSYTFMTDCRTLWVLIKQFQVQTLRLLSATLPMQKPLNNMFIFQQCPARISSWRWDWALRECGGQESLHLGSTNNILLVSLLRCGS